jgi:hypothetical protein
MYILYKNWSILQTRTFCCAVWLYINKDFYLSIYEFERKSLLVLTANSESFTACFQTDNTRKEG